MMSVFFLFVVNILGSKNVPIFKTSILNFDRKVNSDGTLGSKN